MLTRQTTCTLERRSVIRRMTDAELAAKREAGRTFMARWFANRAKLREANGL